LIANNIEDQLQSKFIFGLDYRCLTPFSAIILIGSVAVSFKSSENTIIQRK